MSVPSVVCNFDITDPQKQGLKQSFNSGVRSVLPVVFRDDGTQFLLRPLVPSTTTYRPWDDVDLTGATVAVSVGTPDTRPTAGGFNATWGGDTTATPISFDDSAASVQTKLNALASITTAGGVTVKLNGNGWLVEFNDVGVQALFTAATVDLFPASTIIIYTAQPGTAAGGGGPGTPAIQQILINQNAPAYNDAWSSLPVAAATVTVLATGAPGSPATNAQWSIFLNPAPYDGTFTITTTTGTTTQIPYNATNAQVQAALNVLGGGTTNWNVTGNPGLWYVTNNTGTNIATFTVDPSGLVVPKGLTGAVEFDSSVLYALFQATTDDSINLDFEISITWAGQTKQTVLQIPCQIFRDVMQGGVVALANVPTAYTQAEADAEFVHNASTVTGFTGGGSANMDGYTATVTRSTGQLFAATVDGLFYVWRLVASTAATNAPYFIRPSDYDGTTNQKVYNLVASASPTGANAGTENLIGIVTGLSGGGASNLDGITTAAGATALNTLVIFTISGVVNGWYLRAGTDATASGIQRPADYDGSTNAVVWQRVL